MIRIATLLLLIPIAIHATALRSFSQVVSNEDIALEQPRPLFEEELEIEENDLDAELEEPLVDLEPLRDVEEATEAEGIDQQSGSTDLLSPLLPPTEKAHSPSTIHMLKTKHVKGQWACISLQDIFEEEIAAGACRLTNADNLVIVRTHDPSLFENIAQLLKELDVPDDNPINAQMASTQRALGSTLQVQLQKDEQYRQISDYLNALREKLDAMASGSPAPDTTMRTLQNEIRQLEARKQKIREEVLPRILNRIQGQIKATAAPPNTGKQSESFNDAKTHALVNDWHAAPASEREEISQSLEQRIEAQFEERQQRQLQQVNQLRQRLMRLESSIERRIENRNEIIQQTTKKLLSGSSAKLVSLPDGRPPKDSPSELPSSQPRLTAGPQNTSGTRLPTVEELALFRSQMETAEAMFRSGTLSHIELLRAQTQYQSAASAVRQKVADLETKLRLWELDLEEAEKHYAANKHEAARLRELGRNGSTTQRSVKNATDQAQLSWINVERAKVQLDAARRKWEALKMVKESLDTADE